MKETPVYYFLIPVFNEAENISLLRSDLAAFMPSLEMQIVFIDDASSDGTCAEIKLQFLNAFTHIITKSARAGAGDSFRLGLEYIRGRLRSQDVVIMMEGDGTSDIGILPDLIGAIESGADLALASVYAQGGGFDQTSFVRRFISAIANRVMRWRFGLESKTVSSFYRVWSGGLVIRMLERFNPIIRENGYTAMIELLVKAKSFEANVVELPMHLNSSRRKGKSKMRILPVTIAYLRLMLRRFN